MFTANPLSTAFNIIATLTWNAIFGDDPTNITTSTSQVYGRLYESDSSYLPANLVDYTVLERETIAAPNFGASTTIYIAIDPASHHTSYAGMTAVAHTVTGNTIVLGMAELSMQRCEVAQCEMCVCKFVSRVLLHASLRRIGKQNIRVVPIVECNGSDVLSGSLVSAIRQTAIGHGCMYVMPFKRMYFRTAITEDIGMWATEENKLEAVRDVYTAMVKHQIAFVKNMVTIGSVHLLNPVEPTELEIRQLLRNELVQIKDDKHGKLTGKTAETNDDLALSFLWAFKFSSDIQCIAAKESSMFTPRPDISADKVPLVGTETTDSIVESQLTYMSSTPTTKPIRLKSIDAPPPDLRRGRPFSNTYG